MTKTKAPDLPPGVESEDAWIEVIYHNMNCTSDFHTWRTTKFGDVKTEMADLMRYVDKGCFDEIISVAASMHSFVVVLATALDREDLKARECYM